MAWKKTMKRLIPIIIFATVLASCGGTNTDSANDATSGNADTSNHSESISPAPHGSDTAIQSDRMSGTLRDSSFTKDSSHNK